MSSSLSDWMEYDTRAFQARCRAARASAAAAGKPEEWERFFERQPPARVQSFAEWDGQRRLQRFAERKRSRRRRRREAALVAAALERNDREAEAIIARAAARFAEGEHCPAGYTKDHPLTIGGHDYVGGQFIPGDVLARATKAEKAALKKGPAAAGGKTDKPEGGKGKKGKGEGGAKRGVAAADRGKLLDGDGWVNVDSDAVSHAHYDPKAKALTVVFGDDDAVYEYAGVSPEEAAGFADAPSAGVWVNEHLVHGGDAGPKGFDRLSRRVLDPAVCPPEVLAARDRVAALKKAGKLTGESLHALTQGLIGANDAASGWTVGRAQRTTAALLDALGTKKGDKWTMEDGILLEPVVAAGMDNGWGHHGKTGAADVSSRGTTYPTADGKRVVVGFDLKAALKSSSSIHQTDGGKKQDLQFVADGLNPEAKAEDEWVKEGLADAPRLLMYMGGVDVNKKGRDYGFAYVSVGVNGGSYGVGFKAKSDLTIPPALAKKAGLGDNPLKVAKGEAVPPEVLSAASPAEWKALGFDPLRNKTPLKIKGLASPEDLVTNPRLVKQLHAQVERLVAGVDYEGYKAKLSGEVEKLRGSAARDDLQLQAQGVALGGGAPKTAEEHRAAEFARAQKQRDAAKETIKKTNQHVRGLVDHDVKTAMEAIADGDMTPKGARRMLEKHVPDRKSKNYLAARLTVEAESNEHAADLLKALGLEAEGE